MSETVKEELFGAHLRGAPHTKTNSAAQQFAGRTTIASGSATAVVSTTAVKSDSVIQMSFEGNANVASGTNRCFEVKTISDSARFVIGTQDGEAVPRDTIAMWQIWRKGG